MRFGRWLVLGGTLLAACAGTTPAPTRSLAPGAPARARPATILVSQSAQPDAGPSGDTGDLDAGAALEAATAADADPPASHAHEAHAPYPFQAPLPDKWLPKKSPAMRDANLSPGQCRAQLRKARLPLRGVRIGSPGVANPRRIAGRLHHVKFITPRRPSPYGLLDCRLALALDAFASVLWKHGVIAVYVDNFYRPHAHLPGKHKHSQHAYGLAIDLMGLTFRDGTTLRVGDDWHGGIGRPVCGPDAAPVEATPGAIRLRNIVCDVARAGIFQHMLTPNFNKAHHSHFHFDIDRGVKYFVVR
jgi:hypothetical protein